MRFAANQSRLLSKFNLSIKNSKGFHSGEEGTL
jgi:hypothetical protein